MTTGGVSDEDLMSAMKFGIDDLEGFMRGECHGDLPYDLPAKASAREDDGEAFEG